eukprot:2193250-Pleurochrysis_carterae.AAC.1
MKQAPASSWTCESITDAKLAGRRSRYRPIDGGSMCETLSPSFCYLRGTSQIADWGREADELERAKSLGQVGLITWLTKAYNTDLLIPDHVACVHATVTRFPALALW